MKLARLVDALIRVRAKEIALKAASAASLAKPDKEAATPVKRDAVPKKKLSFKEQREADAIPGLIARLEAEQALTRAQLEDGSLYARDAQAAAQLHARDSAIDDELRVALERQEALLGR